MILALPATDGAVLVSDTRKWFRDGTYVDGHRKLADCVDGLVTGTGSGRLLDHVTAHSGRRIRAELALLIAHTATLGFLAGERAEWTTTFEPPTQGDEGAPPHIRFEVFDGFSYKPEWWTAGNLPTGLGEPFLGQACSEVRRITEGRFSIKEIRSLVIDLYVRLHPSGLISDSFDFGTHRPGRLLSIERVSCAPLLARSSRVVQLAGLHSHDIA